jgi:hypothetical protein
MKKLSFETIFLIVSGLSIIVIILFISFMINFLASNLSKIFTSNPNTHPIQKFNIQKFEDLKIFKERGVK